MLGAHVVTTLETGQIGYRAGGLLASDDQINIVVHGKQTHSSTPWTGVDAIVVASQIVLGLQTIASRQMEVTKAPVVITVTTIGGGGENVVAEKVAMTVTLRTFDPEMRKDAKMRIKRTAASIAAAAGATVDAVENAEMAAPGVYNDPTLMARLLPTLRRVAGEKNVVELPPQTYADDFSFYQEKIPGVLVVLGARKPGGSLDEYAPNHSQHFKIDEASLDVGVRTLANMTVDYLLGAR
jgi:amidohydrolase